MKRTFLMLSTILFAWGSAWSQGTVYFANANQEVNAPIRYRMSPYWGWPTELCQGPDWVAGLWYGPMGTPEWQLTPHPTTATFSTVAAHAGYFFGGARTIDTIPAGAVAVLQVRVWNIQAGRTWEEAEANCRNPYPMGVSALFNVTLKGWPYPPANLVGLQSFTAVIVPEPTAAALLALGGLVFWWRRRVEKWHSALGVRQGASIND